MSGEPHRMLNLGTNLWGRGQNTRSTAAENMTDSPSGNFSV